VLVLSRKLNGGVRVHTSDGPIEIQITAIVGGTVQLGLTAPRAVAIYREEVDPYVSPRTPDA
jgi:carbon storage regulator CsrA